MVALALVALAYVSSYYILSRNGFRSADAVNAEGFWFFPPENTGSWRVKNYSLVVLYYPLIWLDQALGTGRAPAHEPLWEVSG